MGIVADMKAWVENAERAGDDNYGAAAQLMREAIERIAILEASGNGAPTLAKTLGNLERADGKRT